VKLPRKSAAVPVTTFLLISPVCGRRFPLTWTVD